MKIPVIGLGGISCANDAIEFLLAGASAVQIGTANFIDPTVTIKVIDGINDYLDQERLQISERNHRFDIRNKKQKLH